MVECKRESMTPPKKITFTFFTRSVSIATPLSSLQFLKVFISETSFHAKIFHSPYLLWASRVHFTVCRVQHSLPEGFLKKQPPPQTTQLLYAPPMLSYYLNELPLPATTVFCIRLSALPGSKDLIAMRVLFQIPTWLGFYSNKLTSRSETDIHYHVSFLITRRSRV